MGTGFPQQRVKADSEESLPAEPGWPYLSQMNLIKGQTFLCSAHLPTHNPHCENSWVNTFSSSDCGGQVRHPAMQQSEDTPVVPPAPTALWVSTGGGSIGGTWLIHPLWHKNLSHIPGGERKAWKWEEVEKIKSAGQQAHHRKIIKRNVCRNSVTDMQRRSKQELKIALCLGDGGGVLGGECWLAASHFCKLSVPQPTNRQVCKVLIS